MQRFVKDGDVKRIQLEDGDWIEIPAKVSYGTISEIGEYKGSDMQRAAFMISKVVLAWNFEADPGVIAPITLETINKLDIGTVKEIANVLGPLLGVEKKA